MRSRGSVGSDSRVREADLVSMAAIFPGPVQAWPRPNPGPGPAPTACARTSPHRSRTVLLCNCQDSPAHRLAEGRCPGRLRLSSPGLCASAVAALCVCDPCSAELRPLCPGPTCSPSDLSKSLLPFQSLNLPSPDPFQF